MNRAFPTTRMRRLRSSAFTRELVAETFLTPSQLIYPIFVIEGLNVKEAIPSMPDIFRLSLDLLLIEIEELLALGVTTVALFPVIAADKKSLLAEEAYN